MVAEPDLIDLPLCSFEEMAAQALDDAEEDAWVEVADSGGGWEQVESDETKLGELRVAHAAALAALKKAEEAVGAATAAAEEEKEKRVAAQLQLADAQRTVIRQRLIIARQQQEMRNLLGPGGRAGDVVVGLATSRRDRRAALRADEKKSRHSVTSGRRGKVAFAAMRGANSRPDHRQKGSFASKGSSVSRAGGFKKQ